VTEREGVTVASEFRGIEVFGRAPRARAPRKSAAGPRKPTNRPRQRRRARLGIAALLAALVTLAGTVIGTLSAMAGRYESGTLLAYLSTGASVVAVLCGLAAVVTGRGRIPGFLGLVIGIAASPPVLTRLLAWASGLG